jgi:hypothetical protein
LKELNTLGKDLMSRQKNSGPIRHMKNKSNLDNELPKWLLKIKEEFIPFE